MVYKKTSLLILFGLIATVLLCQATHKPAYVWAENEADSRLQIIFFRQVIDVSGSVDSANIHLFADSRYHLSVNGNFVNFGPARFYPEHPEYDSYDLKPFLHQGENVISVKVMSNGVSTFQLRRHEPGLIIWGKVQTASKTHQLATPGNWKCYRSEGYDPYTARMTFALGPMEVYDARKDKAVLGWEYPGFDDSAWANPEPLGTDAKWGELKPRTIPHLTKEVYLPHRLLGVYNFQGEEDLYSFQVLKNDKTWEGQRSPKTFLGYTYIFSPEDQKVEAGIWWGNHYLNAKGPLEQTPAPANQPHRQQMELDLKKGWNFFFVRRNTFMGKWAFQMALPKAAALHLSPDKIKDDSTFFVITGDFPEDLPAPGELGEADDLQALSSNWIKQSQNGMGNPAMEMAWQYLGEKRATPADPTKEITIAETSGTALVYDFRYKKLGRIIVEYEAPAGTKIDVGFTEDLIGDQANVMKRTGLYMATRHIAAGGKGRLETFKPYGLRYLQINVSNHQSPVVIKKVQVVNQVYPFKKLGHFECSDPLMNDIWNLGWRTLEVCAEDSYTDTPFRERGLYAGDMLPQMAITLVGSGDLRLVKRSLRLFQDMYVDQFNPGTPRHPDEIGLLEDYPLLTLEALSWYVDRTNDLAFARELLPAYERLLKTWFEKRNQDGIIHNKQVFIEWTQLEKRDVSNTAFHAILIRSCALMARLQEKVGQKRLSQYYLQKGKELTQSLNQQFWNPEKKLYSDGIKAGQQIDHFYPISNAWPYIAGITNSNQHQSIFPFIADALADIGSVSRQKKATPYGAFYLLAALYDYGLPEVAEQFIRKEWSPMIYRHNDTAWENFDDKNIGTLSHAWSGAPTYYLTAQVLGVDLGWLHPKNVDQVVIAPQSASIDWAKGAVPHPRGLIQVNWEVRGNLLWMECEVPDGIDWMVEPKGRLGELELWVNGKKR